MTYKKHKKNPRFVSIVYVRYLMLERIKALQQDCDRVISLLKQGCEFDDSGKNDLARTISVMRMEIHAKTNEMENCLAMLSEIEKYSTLRNSSEVKKD